MTADRESDTKRVLVTGISGTGKSTVIAELAERGYDAIDLDEPEWSEEIPVPADELTGIGPGRDWVWREERVRSLLDLPDDGMLFLGGCSSNQGTFYAQLDHIVLLTAPEDVIVSRLATRTTNPFGKLPDELDRVLQLKREVEPLLRNRATLQIDTSLPIERVVGTILHHAGAHQQAP